MTVGNLLTTEKSFLNVTTRQSLIFIIPKIILFEIIVIICYLILEISLHYFDIDSGSVLWFNLNFWSTILIQSVNLYLIIRIIMRWINTYYILTSTKLIIKNGVMSIHEIEYNVKHLETFSIEQNFFGKLFDYGNIKIYNAVSKEKFKLKNVPHPFKYLELLELFSTENGKEM